MEGDETALSESAQRGAVMFFKPIADGGANCASCHSGDFMTDEDFHVLAVPQIGRGKGGNDSGASVLNDFGRFRETGYAVDMFKFRTPALLNVASTGPWEHAGAYTTIRHHMNPAVAIANYDFSQLAPNIQAEGMLTNTQFHLGQLEVNRTADVAKVLQNVEMTDAEVTDMVEFMRALTDPCVEDRACLAPWVPDAGDTNPDLLRINAVDNMGAFL